ncbi:pyridoxamine 5'-phosphate oxidase family protein [Kribbella sp. NPDC051620]|uniref:pyridoxamine 5'-phosphate oxidase family protein n=1 Tax=Kribbella sp. NPDC051620 TaxID=3364120 RepID=UPI003793A129
MEPQGVVHTQFSQSDAEAPAWSDIVGLLEAAEMSWLSTVRRDGRPHVTPLPAIWLDGALHFCTGPAEQKARNLEHNPNCILTTGVNEYRRGTDVVIEGQARRVTDPETLTALARRWKEKLDWNYKVGDGGFINGDYHDVDVLVFELRPAKVLAFTKNPYSQTRYTPPS